VARALEPMLDARQPYWLSVASPVGVGPLEAAGAVVHWTT
jgi:hypothetical protein